MVGGCRFPGYDAASSLAEEGYRVKILDDRGCPGPAPGDVERGDPLDYNLLSSLSRDADLIYNFYEYSGIPESRRDPERAFAANTVMPSLLYRVIPQSRVQRIIHASTAAVYGEPETVPVTEEHPARPLDWYGATKLAGEALLWSAWVERGVEVVVLRFFNIYGPGEWLRENPGVVHYFMKAAVTGGVARLEGGGGQVRDFIHVADAVRASLAAVKLEPGFYNVGSGKGTSIRELLGLIAAIHGGDIGVVIAPRRYNDVSRSIAGIGKIAGAGWRPLIPLEEGLRHLYAVYEGRLRGSP